MPFSWPSAAAFSAALTSSAVVVVVQDGDQIDHGDVRGRNAHRVAVQLALQFRHHQADRLGGAGGGRDHVDRGGAGAAQILVREIEDVLIVGVAVDRGHRALFDAELLVQDLHNGRQAVGGAGGIRNDVVLGGIVGGIVHAEHDGDVFVLRRSGDDDLLHRTAQVLGGILGIGEAAGGFDDDLRADAGPIESRPGSLVAKTLMRLAADRDRVSPSCVTSPCKGPSTESYFSRCASVLVSVRSLTATNSISGFVARTNDIPADAAEAIDTYFDCHRGGSNAPLY